MPKVTLGEHNRITLPRDVIPKGVERFDVQVDKEGRIILTPLVEVPSDQAWFWSRKWQTGERQASRDIQEGRLKRGTANQIMAEVRERRKARK